MAAGRYRAIMLLTRPCLLATAVGVMAVTAACGASGDADATSTPGATTQAIPTRTVVPSVTRDVTNTPASQGGPTSGSVTIADAFPALPDIRRPVVLTEIPGADAFLVVSQEGDVFAFDNDDGAAALHHALDWTDRTSRAGNEEGLLGLALSPTFADDGFVFLYYSAANPRRSVISRFETEGAGAQITVDPSSELIILEVPQPFANHNGGNILFGPDGMLYIGLGDGGSGGDPQGNGQDPSTLLGSILRIDVGKATRESPYTIPADNPAIDFPGARPETFAFGFRNPWRFSFDRLTGELWAGDVGQQRREEIDLVRPGGNYGWNVMEGFECHEAASCDQAGLALPVVDYGREGGNCSVTGGYVVRGESAGTLAGWYVYGDFCSGRLWALNPAEADARPQAQILRQTGPQIASFAEDSAGNLYMLSFDGRVYGIEG